MTGHGKGIAAIDHPGRCGKISFLISRRLRVYTALPAVGPLEHDFFARAGSRVHSRSSHGSGRISPWLPQPAFQPPLIHWAVAELVSWVSQPVLFRRQQLSVHPIILPNNLRVKRLLLRGNSSGLAELQYARAPRSLYTNKTRTERPRCGSLRNAPH